MFDAEGHDVDSRGIGVVEAHELFGLNLTTGEDGVGAGEDRRLLEGPILGFTFVEFGLHALERVEGHDERDTQFVLEPVTGQTTQPVIRVDGVGGPVTAKERRDRVGELRDVIRQALTIKRGGRPGRDVVDAKTGLHVHRVAHRGVVATGIDVHVVPEAGQGAREFADVDVHAPAVARSGLGQRRRVIREHRESSHGGILPALALIQRGNLLSGRLREHDVGHVASIDEPKISGVRRGRGVIASQVQASTETPDAALQQPSIGVARVTNHHYVTGSDRPPTPQRRKSFAREIRRRHGRTLDGHASKKELQERFHFSER